MKKNIYIYLLLIIGVISLVACGSPKKQSEIKNDINASEGNISDIESIEKHNNSTDLVTVFNVYDIADRYLREELGEKANEYLKIGGAYCEANKFTYKEHDYYQVRYNLPGEEEYYYIGIDTENGKKYDLTEYQEYMYNWYLENGY